jgi:hypothetical protein
MSLESDNMSIASSERDEMDTTEGMDLVDTVADLVERPKHLDLGP